jgi:hypothetical protein
MKLLRSLPSLAHRVPTTINLAEGDPGEIDGQKVGEPPADQASAIRSATTVVSSSRSRGPSSTGAAWARGDPDFEVLATRRSPGW